MRSNRLRIRRQVLRRRASGIGQLLLDSLLLEKNFAFLYRRRAGSDLLRKWKFCKGTISLMVRDYAIAMKRYRRAVRASFFGRSKRPF